MGVFGFISFERMPLMCDSITTGWSQVGFMSAYLSRAVPIVFLLVEDCVGWSVVREWSGSSSSTPFST